MYSGSFIYPSYYSIREVPSSLKFNTICYAIRYLDEAMQNHTHTGSNDGPQIPTTGLENLAVTTAKIYALAVTTDKINDLAVTTGKINDLAVTAAKIGSLAVTTAKIDNYAVTTPKLGDASVTTIKIGDVQVTNPKLGELSVGTSKLQDLSVTSAKLNTAAVTAGKINSDASYSTAQERYYRISPYEFAIDNPTKRDWISYSQYGLAFNTLAPQGGGVVWFFAPIKLPNGAAVTSVTVYLVNAYPGTFMQVEVTQRGKSPNPYCLAPQSWTNGGGIGNYTLDYTSAYITTTNSANISMPNSYEMYMCIGLDHTNILHESCGIGFGGARITYTITAISQ